MSRTPRTRWSLVLRAGRGSVAALEELCGVYWFPVYASFRRHGFDPEDAREQTQELFTGMLRRKDLARVEQDGSRFRAWLFTAVGHHAANARAHAGRARRAGVHVDDAEERLARTMSPDLGPDAAFERAWALAMIDGAMLRLRARYEDAGQLRVFEVLSPVLHGGSGPYAELAADLALQEGAVKVAVHRLRKRFGEALREEVLDTVDGPDAVDDELRALLAALGASPR